MEESGTENGIHLVQKVDSTKETTTKDLSIKDTGTATLQQDKIDIIDSLKEKIGLRKLDDSGKWNFIYAGHFIKKAGGKEHAMKIIELAAIHPYWSKRITKVKDIWQNCVAIVNDYKNKK